MKSDLSLKRMRMQAEQLLDNYIKYSILSERMKIIVKEEWNDINVELVPVYNEEFEAAMTHGMSIIKVDFDKSVIDSSGYERTILRLLEEKDQYLVERIYFNSLLTSINKLNYKYKKYIIEKFMNRKTNEELKKIFNISFRHLDRLKSESLENFALTTPNLYMFENYYNTNKTKKRGDVYEKSKRN